MDILYTDTDQIRGTMMLAAEDLPDSLFNVTLLVRELRLDLNSWLPTHANLYIPPVTTTTTTTTTGVPGTTTTSTTTSTTSSTTAAPTTTATPAAQTASDLLISYATYWCAYQTARTLAVSLPQKISDGKNSRDLFPDLTGLLELLASRMANAKDQLLDPANATPSGYAQFTAVGLSPDPVTYNGT